MGRGEVQKQRQALPAKRENSPAATPYAPPWERIEFDYSRSIFELKDLQDTLILNHAQVTEADFFENRDTARNMSLSQRNQREELKTFAGRITKISEMSKVPGVMPMPTQKEVGKIRRLSQSGMKEPAHERESFMDLRASSMNLRD